MHKMLHFLKKVQETKMIVGKMKRYKISLKYSFQIAIARLHVLSIIKFPSVFITMKSS